MIALEFLPSSVSNRIERRPVLSQAKSAVGPEQLISEGGFEAVTRLTRRIRKLLHSGGCIPRRAHPKGGEDGGLHEAGLHHRSIDLLCLTLAGDVHIHMINRRIVAAVVNLDDWLKRGGSQRGRWGRRKGGGDGCFLTRKKNISPVALKLVIHLRKFVESFERLWAFVIATEVGPGFHTKFRSKVRKAGASG